MMPDPLSPAWFRIERELRASRREAEELRQTLEVVLRDKEELAQRVRQAEAALQASTAEVL